MGAGGVSEIGVDARSLAALCVVDEAFDKIDRRRNDYCPFEALAVARHEIRHSNFLADILNPYGTHQFGDGFLRQFLDLLLSVSGSDSDRLDIHLSDSPGVELRREWQNIDLVLLIETRARSYAFVIEIKIEAGEHGNQLARYRQIAEKQWPDHRRYYILLSPEGIDATDEAWTSLSFAQLLASLEPGQASVGGSESARMMLAAWFAMLRRRYVPDEDLEELARKLWLKHGAALNYLMEMKPSPLRDASLLLREGARFAHIASAVHARTGLRIVQDRCSNTYHRIAVPDWDSLPGLMGSTWTESGRVLMCEVEFYGSRIHVRMLLGPGDPATRLSLFRKLRDGGANTGKKTEPTTKFSRLAARTLALGAPVDDAETGEVLAAIAEKGIVTFLADTLPQYDHALRSA